QLCQDIAPLIPNVQVPSWSDFFQLLALVKEPSLLALDEFPYLVKSQPSLTSILQKFIDHDCPPNLRIVLLGSSQTMMHSLFLSSHSPLYERAGEILHIRPMNYRHFCEAKSMDPLQKENFKRYALVGGVPRYWDFIDQSKTLLEIAESLYFENSARLESEPDRLLKDENLVGEQAKFILELVGRGVRRPSEMASRMAIKQTSLSKPLEALIHASLLTREVPFGESVRTTKRTLYTIVDPVLSFWYSVYSPHRTLWTRYSSEQKSKLLHDHASQVFEAEFRRLFHDGCRYWENELEFDCVRYADGTGKKIIISEVKFKVLSPPESHAIEKQLEDNFDRSKLAEKYQAAFEVIDLGKGLHQLAVAT
ncbi:MAG: ATP-binding protein, partial [Oligoflexus sp.]